MRAATGVEATVAALAKSLPCPASILPDFLVAFASTGPKRIDEMVLAIQTDKSPVLVRTRVVYEWLRALKALTRSDGAWRGRDREGGESGETDGLQRDEQAEHISKRKGPPSSTR